MRSGGFSLIELVAVLVVLGILVAAVALRLDATSARGAIHRADELRHNLAHIQQLALGWGDRLRLTVTANSYNVTCRSTVSAACTSVGSIPNDPATGAPFTVSLSDTTSSVTLAATGGNTVDFDSLGRPIDPATGLLVATAPAARTYTLTGGTRVATVTLQSVTGFAATSY